MPALNFQARFAPAVESGEKCQTIRAYRKDGRDPKPGDTLYLYTGMRTKACRKLGEVRCLNATPIRIAEHNLTDGFARMDGFRSADEMFDWFDKTHGLPFKGLLIRWEKPG